MVFTYLNTDYFDWKQEYDYFASYRAAMYGYTKLKAGWDCNRHYEILAQGTAPWFEQLELSPAHTMMHLPKQLLIQLRDMLPYNADHYDSNDYLTSLPPKAFNHTAYWIGMQRLMHYTQQRLTTTALAKYMLMVTGKIICI